MKKYNIVLFGSSKLIIAMAKTILKIKNANLLGIVTEKEEILPLNSIDVDATIAVTLNGLVDSF